MSSSGLTNLTDFFAFALLHCSMLCLVRRALKAVDAQRRVYSVPASSVVLRPYQESSIDACLDALKSGSSRIGVSLPTGSGKTTVFISLLDRIKPPPENRHASRALVVVNSIELARQAAAQAEKLHPDWSVEIEQGSKHHASGDADLYVFTVLGLQKTRGSEHLGSCLSWYAYTVGLSRLTRLSFARSDWRSSNRTD